MPGSAPGHGGRNDRGWVQSVQVFLDASGIPHDGFDAQKHCPGGGSGKAAGVVDLRRYLWRGGPGLRCSVIRAVAMPAVHGLDYLNDVARECGVTGSRVREAIRRLYDKSCA